MTEVNRPLPLFARAVLKPVLAIALRCAGFSVVHGERLPRHRRPLILASNHAALADSLYFAAAVAPRFTVCGAKPKYFRSVLRRAAMRVLNVLPFHGEEQFVADCAALLRAGETILMYPEMGRRPDGLGEFAPLAARVALAAGVPIVPCYLHGTTRAQRGAPALVVGDPLQPDGDALALTRRLRAEIAALRTAFAAGRG